MLTTVPGGSASAGTDTVADAPPLVAEVLVLEPICTVEEVGEP